MSLNDVKKYYKSFQYFILFDIIIRGNTGKNYKIVKMD